MTKPSTLDLQDTRVTDAGLSHLKRLTGLSHPYINYTPVADAGLIHLNELTGLSVLHLRLKRVADAGI